MLPESDVARLRSALSLLAQLRLAEAAGWSSAERSDLRRLGRDKLRQGDGEAACALLEYAALLDLDSAEAWDLAAAARIAAGWWPEALTAVQVAWCLEPHWRRATVAVLCCARQGDVAAAECWRAAARATAPADEAEREAMERALAAPEEGGS